MSTPGPTIEKEAKVAKIADRQEQLRQIRELCQAAVDTNGGSGHFKINVHLEDPEIGYFVVKITGARDFEVTMHLNADGPTPLEEKFQALGGAIRGRLEFLKDNP